MCAIVVLAVATLGPACAAWPNGYTYREQLTIDHTKVAGPLTNFPVLVAGTFPELATVANGGSLRSANGFDLIVASDASGANPLSFERVSWSASTGALVMMVRVPSLSSAADTPLYLFFGNSAISVDQQNKTGVWDSNYLSVFHLSENAASTSLTDSSARAHTGATVATTSSRTATGPFNGGTAGTGISFNGSGDWADLGTSSDFDVSSGDATWEIWVRPATLNNSGTVLAHGTYGVDGYYVQWANQSISPGVANVFNGSTGDRTASTPDLVSGSWIHLTFVKYSTIGTWYINGVPSGHTNIGNFTSSARHLWLARYDTAYSSDAMTLAEFRFSNTARTPEWIATSFLNQSSPSAFYTAGAPQMHTSGAPLSSFLIF